MGQTVKVELAPVASTTEELEKNLAKEREAQEKEVEKAAQQRAKEEAQKEKDEEEARKAKEVSLLSPLHVLTSGLVPCPAS